MGDQIAIIGLDKVGLSLGLALKNVKNPITRVGFDLDTGAMKSAEKTGAVDKTVLNLHSAVEKADLVLLNLTAGEVLEYAESIVGSMQAGSILINMAPVHVVMCDWSISHLPAGCSLLNMTPVQAGGFLNSDEPSADLFKGSICLVSSPRGTNGSAIQQVVDLVDLMGASPLFSDPLEGDGYLSLTDLFPRIVSTLYLQASFTQPGWQEAGKAAGSAYWHISMPVRQFIAGKFAAREILLQKENVLRYLGLLQDEITDLKDAIQKGDEEKLGNTLQETINEQNLWMTNRLSGQWEKTPADIQKLPAGGWKKLLGMEPPGKKN
jgi:prephenate dehydrogenase